MNLWIISIILIGIIGLYNIAFGFLSEKTVRANPILKVLAIIAAAILLFLSIRSEINKYLNYSFVQVTADGEIVKSKGFKYGVRLVEDKDNKPLYIIDAKYDSDNLKIRTKKKVTPEITVRASGLGIQFLSSEPRNHIVKTSFIAEIQK